MKSPVVAYVGWLLIAAAALFYGYGIFEAIRISWSPHTSESPLAYPEVLSTTIGSMQALLLANLGMVLGISIANPNSGMARSLLLNKSEADRKLLAPPPPLEIKDKVQLVALIVYILALIACLVTWGKNGFSTDSKDVVSIISESGKMFIGVVLAYLTAVLSK
jgi:hypothetical protein